MSATLPTDATARKNAPMYCGLLKYFPRALAYVAEVSRIGNEQHNPGQPLRWAKEKSTDHGDCIVRHQCDAGTRDSDNVRHSGKVAWRALAQLEIELEEAEKAQQTHTLGAGEMPPHEPKADAPNFCAHSQFKTITNHETGAVCCGGCGTNLRSVATAYNKGATRRCNHAAYAVHTNGIERSCAGCGERLADTAAVGVSWSEPDPPPGGLKWICGPGCDGSCTADCPGRRKALSPAKTARRSMTVTMSPCGCKLPLGLTCTACGARP